MNEACPKFDRWVVACRTAGLKIKTSSRVKSFQESKDYGSGLTN